MNIDPDPNTIVRQGDRPAGTGSRIGRWIAGLLVVAIALAAVAALVRSGIQPRLKARAALKAETDDLAVPTVSTVRPRRAARVQEVVLPGSTQPLTDAPIYARTNGYLKTRYVDIGSRVKTGQLLADIDAPEIDQQIQQARADLATVESNYRLSQITAERYQELLKTDSVSKQEVDNATGDFQARRTVVESARHNLNRLEELRSFTKIYAPFDGVVTARNVDVGALIDSGSARKELFHIASTEKLRLFVNVPQIYSRAAKPGLTAELALAEFPGRRFKATLVRTAEVLDTASRTLLSEFELDNASGELLSGSYAEVHLKLPSPASAFLLPVNALLFRAEGMQVAYVEDGKRARFASISLGRDFGTEVEVISGLNGEESVIVNPPDSLVPGQPVRLQAPADGGEARP